MQKEWKQKIPRKRFVRFGLWIQKVNDPKKILVEKGTDFAGEFEKLYKAEGIHIYFTMSETKAAYAERTIRSLKNMLYCYMEDNGYKYIHKVTQFVTTLNSRRNCSIDLIPKKVKNSEFFAILYSRPLRELRKPNIKIGNRLRNSQ